MCSTSEIFFNNANSRETYFTIHNIKIAHRYGKGKGVKVGVLDWLFGRNSKSDLYGGFIDLTNSNEELLNNAGHGYWMATVLKEIAPECDIYAINCIKYEGEKSQEENDVARLTYFEKAIDWAISNNINILTYSHPRFSAMFIEKFNKIVEKASQNNIITTFIHCDSENNIWPFGCMPLFHKESYVRAPDYNIYHYDYNLLFISQYENFVSASENNELINSGDKLPYFSFSSMSPVLGGFIAILKSISINLTKDEIKSILDKTAYSITENGAHWYDINPCQKVVDIGSAAKEIYIAKQV